VPAPQNGSAAWASVLQAWQQYVLAEGVALAAKGIRLGALNPAGDGALAQCHNGSKGAARAFLRALALAAKTPPRVERLCVQFGVGCGGRAELLAAAARLARRAAAGRLEPSEITAGQFEACFASRDVPQVDLLIRTGGSQQLSDFLMWQAAYAELLFMDVPWAQFRREHFKAALDDYARRRRTFGALPEA
jgi:undecaprenyl pyrophosphate synthase